MKSSFYRPFTSFDVKTFLIDEKLILYHSGSGQTHCLSSVVGEVYNQVRHAESPVDVNNLKLLMPGLLETEEIMRILASLLALHLIESAD